MMVDYPDSVKVGAQSYALIFRSRLDSLGEFDIEAGRIQIRKNLGPLGSATTLLHELIHAISDTWGGDMSEEQTRCMEQGLATVIQSNPGLMEKIVNDIAGGDTGK